MLGHHFVEKEMVVEESTQWRRAWRTAQTPVSTRNGYEDWDSREKQVRGLL